jgi:hypothetical protein
MEADIEPTGYTRPAAPLISTRTAKWLLSRWILPRLIDLAMGADRLDAYRRRTIGTASDLVLEIGVGSGQNLPLYGSAAIITLIVLVRTRETAFAPLR